MVVRSKNATNAIQFQRMRRILRRESSTKCPKLPPTAKPTTTMASSTKEASQTHKAGIAVVDPITGKQIELEYQSMRLHPCEIIAENPSKYDETAVKVSKTFQDYYRQGKTPPSSARANSTRIEATDLFDPELLSTQSPTNLKS